MCQYREGNQKDWNVEDRYRKRGERKRENKREEREETEERVVVGEAKKKRGRQRERPG